METVLQDLPAEIFFRIFSYLPPKDLASNVALVCTYWHSFSVDECIWKYHCLNRWGYWQHAQEQIEGGGLKDERLNDVQNKLKLGGLSNVEVFNARRSTPSPDYLRKFNAVLFFSYHGFDQVSVGNMLADFVEMGGGVVFCAYGNCGRGNRLDGKWALKQYDPLTLGSTTRTPSLSLGKLHDAKHPILDGVTVFDGGEQSSHGDGPAHPEATVIAEWSNGRPLVVELKTQKSSSRKNGEIIGLNMYPPSSEAASGGWSAATHGARLMANALHYVARGS